MRRMPHDVLLVDDDKLMRDGIRAILERGSEFRVAGEAESAADAVQLCKKAHPDLVILDIGLPGIEATAERHVLPLWQEHGIRQDRDSAPLDQGRRVPDEINLAVIELARVVARELQRRHARNLRTHFYLTSFGPDIISIPSCLSTLPVLGSDYG